MSDSETESDSVSGTSFKSRSSRSSSSGSTNSDPPILSACQKKKQGLEAISTMDKTIAGHRIILENEKKTGRPELALQIQKSIENFLEIRKKMVSELRTMPPCLDPNCTDHTILKSNDSDPDLSLSNVNDKKQSYKRKNNKQDLEGFAFPKKTIRPTTPTQVLQPIPTRNNFEMLNQDPEPMEEATPRKGTTIKTNYSNIVNSIVRPNTSYAQATSYFVAPQQMAPHYTPAPATTQPTTQDIVTPIPTQLSGNNSKNECLRLQWTVKMWKID
ncbi:hypothetical protein TNIN_78801 [Trichonephila inaurata madagascariensis]|uniref:Uncharacterized protein n=1 Tax=Trichonephila inaurata madagascariensis TaxID=2747483 RepID=A0A8X7CB72_9ARAC|nr:hypothetical protein TNIN_78801 [Trichonephila inaurata madagascariensis]